MKTAASFAPSPIPPGLALYLGDWSPRGIKADWDKCSMEKASTLKLVGDWAEGRGDLIESIAWLDFDGHLRVLVCDFANNTRLIFRFDKRGGWKLSFERHDRTFARPEIV